MLACFTGGDDFVYCSVPEGVNVLTDSVVKSVSYQDDKLEIKLKDGRVVNTRFYFVYLFCLNQLSFLF